MISSSSNDKVKYVTKLLSSPKKRREDKCFVVEGERIVREIPLNKIRECYISESFDAAQLPPGIKYEVVGEAAFKKMSDTVNPQGVLCLVDMLDADLEVFIRNLSGDKKVKLLILESVQDPGNLGTMIRTAEAAGFDAIIADKSTVDLYNPKVIRSTMGSMFRVPFFCVSDLKEELLKLKKANIKLCAAHLRGQNDFDEVDYGDRIGILIGNEGNGLSDEISDMADLLVKIPMEGKIESLNAAVAAAIMMYRVR